MEQYLSNIKQKSIIMSFSAVWISLDSYVCFEKYIFIQMK